MIDRKAALLALPLLLVAVAFTGPGVALPGSQDADREEEAQELLELAEERAAKGQYDQAVSRYEKVVDKFAGTEAAAVAAKRITPNALLGWADLVRNGPSSNRVDVVVMGDGFERKSLKNTFHSRADDIPDAFEEDEALREYLPYFNFIRAAVVSAEDGVDAHGREYDTALGGYQVNSAGVAIGTVKVERVQHYLSQLPEHDGLAVVVMAGISNALPAGPVATIGGGKVTAPEVIHAWGHAFAGLGDEYANEEDRHAFTPGPRPNVSLSETDVPWQHWIDAKHPSVGVYEGAGNQVRGAFRPVGGNCVMESGRDFCPVCREMVVLSIYAIVDPIDEVTPEPLDVSSEESLAPELVPTSDTRYQSLEFTVTPMEPEKHSLEARWWVLPEHRAPSTRGVALDPAARRLRGKLPELDAEPLEEQTVSRSGTYEFELDPGDWEPGRYRVVCRVRDTTEMRGEKYPWVLSDPQGLLESERAWWVEIP